MRCYSYQSDAGHHVSLQMLELRLSDISFGKHHWAVVPVPENFISPDDDAPRSFAIVGYSNPQPSNLPNALCFLIPMLALGGHRNSPQELIVSFSCRSALPLTRGLYFEDDDVKYDCLEDWWRVWHPIRAALWSQPGSEQYSISTNDPEWYEEVTSGRVDSFNQWSEHLYRAEFISYLTVLSESREVIREAIDHDTGFEY